MILETKGYDPLAEVKAPAAQRWVAAVNADGRYGTWRYAMVRDLKEAALVIDRAGSAASAGQPGRSSLAMRGSARPAKPSPDSGSKPKRLTLSRVEDR